MSEVHELRMEIVSLRQLLDKAEARDRDVVSGQEHVARCAELDRRWRRACGLGDALARAAEDLLACPGRDERRALAKAIREYEEG